MPTSSWRVTSGLWSGRRGAGCSLSPLLPCCPRATGRRGFHPAHWCAENFIKRLSGSIFRSKNHTPPLPPKHDIFHPLDTLYIKFSAHAPLPLFLPFSHLFYPCNFLYISSFFLLVWNSLPFYLPFLMTLLDRYPLSHGGGGGEGDLFTKLHSWGPASL